MDSFKAASYELRHLRYFVVLARELHFGKAAQRLGIAQPPLSQQIRALEERLGAKLLSRDTRNVQLTEAGRALYRQATIAIAEAERCVSVVRQADQGETGEVSVAFVDGASALLRRLMPQMRELLPQVRFRLRILGSGPQAQALRSQDIDLGFLWQPASDKDLTVETVLHDHWLVAVPADDPWARRGRATFRMLGERPLCFCQRDITPGLFDDTMRHLADNDVPHPDLRELNSFMTVLNLVSIGEGVGLVPRLSARPTENVRFLPLPASRQVLQLGFAYDGRRSSALMRRVLRVFREVRDSAPLATDPLPELPATAAARA